MSLLMRLLLAGVVLTSFFSASAQEDDKNLKKWERLAGEYYRVEEYHNALPYLLKIDSIDPNNGDHHYRIGVCYLHSVHKKKALPYLEQALKEGGAPDEIYYYLGRCHHLNHNLDEAIRYFQTAKEKLPSYHEVIKVTEREIDREIESCEYAKQQIANPLDYKITNLGPKVNSSAPDYVPVVSADETVLIFTSRREDAMGHHLDISDNLPYEDIYISNKDDNGEWGEAKNIGESINTKYHDASVGISPDGQTLFIYKSDLGGSADHESGNIFTSRWDGQGWGPPEKLPEPINSNDWEPSASIVSDENTMFFASNREGGKGGKDLYMVKRLMSGEWAKPINLETINTEFDEDAPFIYSDDRTLYFSSQGHSSMGGFDVFMSIMADDGSWSEPQNVGYPINTTDDDLFFMWAADGKKGFFSSIRDDSYGDKDLYEVERLQETSAFMVLKGTVLDVDTKEPIAATVHLYEAHHKVTGVYNSRASSGKFTAIIPGNQTFSIKAEAIGYEPDEHKFSTPDVKEYFEQEEIIYLKKAPVAVVDTVVPPIDSVVSPQPGETFVLNNIYFDFDKADLRTEAKAELDKVVEIMNKYPDIRVELGAHTDWKGSETYNMALSGRRARSAVNYVISKGISKDRITDKAYGESQPIAPNDTDENRQKNRRIEFKVMDNKS